MTPEQILKKLTESGLCDKLDGFISLIQVLQSSFKEKHGKYFGSSEFVKLENLNDIFSEFGSDIDETTLNLFEVKDNKLYVKDGGIDSIIKNAYITFHEHKSDKKEFGYTVYINFEVMGIKLIMAKGFGFGSSTIELSVIEEDEF